MLLCVLVRARACSCVLVRARASVDCDAPQSCVATHRPDASDAPRCAADTGAIWPPGLNPNEHVQQWTEVMNENDPISLEPLNHNVLADPPLIVSDRGFIMLKSSYDEMYYQNNWVNPLALPGGSARHPLGRARRDQVATPARKILFDWSPEHRGRVRVNNGSIATENYTPPPRPRPAAAAGAAPANHTPPG